MTDTRPYIDQERSVADAWSAPPRGAGERQVERSSTGSAEGLGNTHHAQARELRRVVAADAQPRRLAAPVTMAQLFLRLDATHELPHVVETETGRIVARFEKAGDVALFIGGEADRKTLPAEYVMQLCGGQS